MMKNFGLSLWQTKELNFTKRSHYLWVQYFTKTTTHTLISIPKNSQLNAHYSNFNFADISMKSLLHQSEAIESNPEESLIALLHLDQPISQQYFKFCSLILEIKSEPNILEKVIQEASIQLFRAIIAFHYQFHKEIQNFRNKIESTFFPFQYISDFPNFIIVLLKNTGQLLIDFLYLLTPILDIFFSDHEEGSLIYNTAQRIFDILLSFTQNHKCQEEEMSPIISFLFNMACYENASDDQFSSLCNLMISNKSIHDFITARTYHFFIQKCKFTFEKIVRQDQSESLFETSALMLQAIACTLNKKQKGDSFDLSPHLISFVEWSMKFDKLPEITIPEIKPRKLFETTQLPSSKEYQFIDLDLFDNDDNQSKNSGLKNVSPIYLSNSMTLTNLIGILAEICSENDIILENIIKELAPKNIISLYLTGSLIFLCRPGRVGHLLTKTNTWDIFASSKIINDATLFNRNGVDPYLVNLKDIVLSILFNSTSKDAASAISKLIDPNFPTIVSTIIQILDLMLSNNFIKESLDTILFDTIMKCYLCFRSYLIEHFQEQENEDMIYMKKSKSFILQFVIIYSQDNDAKIFIFSNDRRTSFLFSLLFEKKSFDSALDIICRALELDQVGLLMRHLNKLIKYGFDHLSNVQWQELLSVLIDCVSVSISTNEHNLMKSFISDGSIYTFSRIPTAFSKIDSTQNTVLLILHKIIGFFTSLVQNMKHVSSYLSDPQWCFVSNIEQALKITDITEETIDLLINFIMSGETLLIKEGIEFLMIACQKPNVSQKVLSFLAKSTKYSIANRYQCFQANVITTLLNFISNSENDKDNLNQALILFQNICASYFRVGELALTIRLIAQTPHYYSYILLNILIDMCKPMKDTYEDSFNVIDPSSVNPKSFFCFTPSSTFKISEFYLPAVFNISMRLYFPKLYTNMKQLFVLSTARGDQQVIGSVITNRFVLQIKNKDKDNQFQLYTKLTPNKWFDFDLAITPTTVSLYVNSTLVISSVIPKRFRFERLVSFFIEHIEVDIQTINIFSRDYYLYSTYTAKLVNEGRVVNTSNGSSIPGAEFYGVPVPFSITLVDAIQSCGGPKIFLPLFECVDSIDFFVKLLELINALIITKETLFNPLFFRSLGHLFSKLNPDFLSSKSLELLLIIYKSMWSKSLRQGMLKYIFGNFDLWSRISQDDQLLMYSGIFTSLLQIDSELVAKTLAFHELLLKFSLIFDETSQKVNDKDDSIYRKDGLMQRSTNFLLIMSQRSFTIRDAQILTASAMDINYNEMCLKSLFLIINLLSDNSASMVTFLKQIGFYKPFITILNSRFEKTRIIALNSLYFIQSILKSNLLSVELIEGIKMLNVTDMTSQTLFNIFAYITKTVNFRDFPKVVTKFNYDKLKPLYHSQFLPLFSAIVALVKPEEMNLCLNYVRQSIVCFEETRKSISTCYLWELWLLFLSNVEKNPSEWIPLFKQIAGESESPVPTSQFFMAILTVYNIDPIPIIDQTFEIQIFRKPSYQLACFIAQYVMFNVEMNVDENSSCEDDAIHTFCQFFVMTKCPYATCTYQDKLSTLKLKLFSQSIKILIQEGIEFLLKTTHLIKSTPSQINQNDVIVVINISDIVFTFVCYGISLIARNDKNLAHESLDLLLPLLRSIHNKPELSNGLLLLFNAYYKVESTIADNFVFLLRQIDPSNQSLSSTITLIDNSKELSEIVEIEMKTTILTQFESDLNAKITSIHKKAVDTVSRVFSEENQKLVDLRNLFTKQLQQAALEQGRFLRSNRKFYLRQLKNMKMQNGGPWFSLSSDTHFKYSSVLDSIGRHNKMQVNFHFKDHHEASMLRDTGAEYSQTNNNNESQSNRSMKRIRGMLHINDSSEVDSPNDFNIELECQMVTTAKYFKGTMYVSPSSIYFEAKQTTDAFGDVIDKMSKMIEINCDTVKFILKRRYLFVDTGCEVFTTGNKSYFFFFGSEKHRHRFFKEMDSFRLKNIEFIQYGDFKKVYKDLQLKKKWQTGAISNYEYLTWLNWLSGRSIHDISQYPVFPWILSDYTSPEIDLSDPKFYRDLSRPIGTFNESRLENLEYLYNETKSTPFASLYRFHYSAPAYVISFLLRHEPFTSLHIQLQNGKFDHPNRLFFSVAGSWESITSIQSDFRELIPEFFATSEFLINSEHFDLGYRTVPIPVKRAASNQLISVEDGTKILDEDELLKLTHHSSQQINLSHNDNSSQVYQKRAPRTKLTQEKNGQLVLNKEVAVEDVELPPWAPSASAFIALNRMALESSIVSSTLHQWIDLIFGYKQRSIEALNLFHPYSYLQTLEEDPSMLQTIQQHAANFGITPTQLFDKAHEKRTFVPPKHLLTSQEQIFFTTAQLYDFATYTDTDASVPERNIKDVPKLAENNSNNSNDVVKISCTVDTFYALFADGTFRTYGFNEKSQMIPQKTSSIDLSSHLKPQRVFIDPITKSVIVSAPWSQGFKKYHKSTIFNQENAHSTIVTDISVSFDGKYAVTGASDSSLIVWNLSVFGEERIQCHIVAHTEEIKSVAISSQLEIVTSCDIGGTLVYSDLRNGNFLRKIKFDEKPSSMYISDLGFVVLLFNQVLNDESGATSRQKTKVVLLDLGARILNELELEGRLTSSIVIHNTDSTSFLCIAQETKVLYILRIYDLKTIALTTVNHLVKDMAYCKENMSLYMLMENNSLYISKF